MPPPQVIPETEGDYMKRPLFSTAVSAAASLVVAGLAASATYSQTQTQLKGEVKIALPYDRAIRPGGFAEARINAGATTAPLLPQSAVLSDSKGNYVYVVDAQKKVERRAVVVGAVGERGIAIVSGLSGQEAIIESAGPFLNPGQKVAPRRRAAAASVAAR